MGAALIEKLRVLADAANYDVACTSSGVSRGGQSGKLGSTIASGLCHSWSADGRCITLLKVLFTNVCIYDCAYCVNRRSNDVPRAAFTPRELADLTIEFYRRNYLEGLFLSSGVIGSPDYTTELFLKTLEILRLEYGFRGYIHAKAVPGTSPELIERLGLLADRLSVNMELPSSQSLGLLCPEKTKSSVLAPMRQISQEIHQQEESRALAAKTPGQFRAMGNGRAFAPAGQSTQMIIGATPESDYRILTLSASLYKTLELKRVFYSAYLPVSADPRLPSADAIQLDREHRLYQADWLLRFYGFDATEIIDKEHPFLDTDIDPKANWALNHLDVFPVEINTAPYDLVVRVPGIGVRGAKKIVKARKTTPLGEEQLRKLGVAYKRARYFITCSGKYAGQGVCFEREALRGLLAAPIDGGRHGRRADRAIPGQLSLWEDTQTANAPLVSPKREALAGSNQESVSGVLRGASDQASRPCDSALEGLSPERVFDLPLRAEKVVV